jgi:hypothetical protein
MPTTKKLDLNLDMFLHSVIYFSIKDTNKHFIFNLGDTNDIMFSLTNFLDFDSIKNYFYKSRILSCVNRTILDIPLNSWQDTTCGSFLIAFMHQRRSDDYPNTWI